jgi:hypothetical protein
MVVGGPYVAIVGSAYIIWLLGPHALVGVFTFILFYPIQYGISTLTGMQIIRETKILLLELLE